jgi:hypothetical protein
MANAFLPGMRATLAFLVLVIRLTSAAAQPVVHVTAATTSSHPATAEHVRAHAVRAARDGAIDVAYEDTTVAAGHKVEVAVKLHMTISDRSGKIIALLRTSATGSSPARRIASLREQVVRDAIDAAIASMNQGS